MSNSTAKRRIKLWFGQGGRCFFCLERTWLPNRNDEWPFFTKKTFRKNKNRMATIEHMHPLSCGGHKSYSDNLVMTCSECNTHRGTVPFFLYMLARNHSVERAKKVRKLYDRWKVVFDLFRGNYWQSTCRIARLVRNKIRGRIRQGVVRAERLLFAS